MPLGLAKYPITRLAGRACACSEEYGVLRSLSNRNEAAPSEQREELPGYYVKQRGHLKASQPPARQCLRGGTTAGPDVGSLHCPIYTATAVAQILVLMVCQVASSPLISGAKLRLPWRPAYT